MSVYRSIWSVALLLRGVWLLVEHPLDNVAAFNLYAYTIGKKQMKNLTLCMKT